MTTAHILALATPEFVRHQLRTVLCGRGDAACGGRPGAGSGPDDRRFGD